MFADWYKQIVDFKLTFTNCITKDLLEFCNLKQNWFNEMAGRVDNLPVCINDWVISDFLKFIEKKEEDFIRGPIFYVESRQFRLGFHFDSNEVKIWLENSSGNPFPMGFLSLSLISKDGTMERICHKDVSFLSTFHNLNVPGTPFIYKLHT